LLLALGLGLAFLLCDGFMAALGTSGRVNAALAALAAPVLFAGIGLIQLRFSEGR
jgi:lipopolysaccharide export system permease protein